MVLLLLDWTETPLLLLLYMVSPRFRLLQGSLPSGSLCDSPFSAPVFFLLYLLPLHAISKLIFFLWYTLFLHPQSLPSFFIASFILSDYPLVIPLVPLCVQIPLESDSIIIMHLSHNNIFIHVPNDFKNLPHGPLKKSLSATLYDWIQSTANSVIYPPSMLSNQKSIA
jgi:hypothetical protein